MREFEAKMTAEADWPARTDWDRLDDVFRHLQSDRILALHNAGHTTSDAHGDAWDLIQRDGPSDWDGFCYYHGQDVERAVDGMPLFLGFDAVKEGADAKVAVGSRVAGALRDAGFSVEWNGDPETRMSVTDLDWKKRTDWDDGTDRGATSPAKQPGFFHWLFGL